MIYYLITVINIYVAIAAIGSLICVARNYFLPKKGSVYLFFKTCAMAYIIFANILNLTLPSRDWRLAITHFLFVCSTFYFSWMIRDKGIKKQ